MSTNGCLALTNELLSAVALVVLMLTFVGCSGIMLKSPSVEPGLLFDKGEHFYRQGQFRLASEAWQKALAAGQVDLANGDRARLHAALARLHEAIGEYGETVRYAQRCLTLARRVATDHVRAECLVTLASVHRRQGGYGASQKDLENASMLVEQLKRPELESDYYRTRGALAQAQRDLQTALTSYERSLQAARVAGDFFREARSLNNLGELMRIQAQYDQARKYYDDALRIRREIKDRAGIASTLSSLCNLQYRLGDYKSALKYCRRSQAIAHRIGAQQREGNSLNSLGAIYSTQKRFDRAIRAYLKSSDIKRRIGDRSGLAKALNNIGELHLRSRRFPEALDYFERSLRIKQDIGEFSGESVTLGNIGLIHEQLGDHEEALHEYSRALRVQTLVDEPEKIWRTFGNLSRVHSKLGNPQAAIFYGKQAINTIQSVRKRVAKLASRYEKSFLQDKRTVYEHLASLLIDAGRYAEAEQVLMMLKDEEYRDYIRTASSSDEVPTVRLSHKEIEFIEGFEGISVRLADIGRNIEKLLHRLREDGVLSEEDEATLDMLEDQRQIAEQQFEAYLGEIQQYYQLMPPRKAPDLEGTEQFQTLLSELGHDPVFIIYLPTEEKLRILITSPQIRIHRDVAISRKELERQAFSLYVSIKNPEMDPRADAMAMYQYLFAPIESDIRDLEARTIMVSLFAGLRYLPLAVLHDGEQYLAEKYALVRYTNRSRARIMAQRQENWTVAGFGVSKGIEEFDPLPAVDAELNGIVRNIVGNDISGLLPGYVYLDERFTAQQLRRSLDQRFPVVHIASHFSLNAGTSDSSFLLLGDGEKLTLNDLADPRFRFGHLDMLALSACETALNQALADGTEVEGFAELVQEKGTKSILATLWKVSDRSTALFMHELYRRLIDPALTKADALQQTRQLFICRDESMSGDACAGSQADYSHPYYWAPFILIGNWL